MAILSAAYGASIQSHHVAPWDRGLKYEYSDDSASCCYAVTHTVFVSNTGISCLLSASTDLWHINLWLFCWVFVDLRIPPHCLFYIRKVTSSQQAIWIAHSYKTFLKNSGDGTKCWTEGEEPRIFVSVLPFCFVSVLPLAIRPGVKGNAVNSHQAFTVYMSSC